MLISLLASPTRSLRGPTTQAAAPYMIRQGGGKLVNIGSISGVTPTPFSGSARGEQERISRAPSATYRARRLLLCLASA